jgi:hypothetical protein
MADPSSYTKLTNRIQHFLGETEDDHEVLGGLLSDDDDEVDEVNYSDHNSVTEQRGISDNEDDVDDSLPIPAIDEPGTAMDIDTEGRSEISQFGENYNKDCHLELNIDECTSDEDELPYAERRYLLFW